MKPLLKGLSLFSCLIILCSVSLMAKDTIQWYTQDFPPFFIFEGEKKGSGILDKVLEDITGELPEYEHKFVVATLPRILNQIKVEKNACYPGLTYSGRRAGYVELSEALSLTPTVRAAFHTDYMKQFEPFIDTAGHLDITGVAEHTEFVIGIEKERNYGKAVAAAVDRLPSSRVRSLSRLDEFQSLLNMVHSKQVQIVLGYSYEVEYFCGQMGNCKLEVLPILSLPAFIKAYVGCGKTDEGKKIIEAINKIIPKKQQTFHQYVYDVLDPQTRNLMRKEVKKVFKTAP